MELNAEPQKRRPKRMKREAAAVAATEVTTSAPKNVSDAAGEARSSAKKEKERHAPSAVGMIH
jgi:hypothetical protein